MSRTIALLGLVAGLVLVGGIVYSQQRQDEQPPANQQQTQRNQSGQTGGQTGQPGQTGQAGQQGNQSGQTGNRNDAMFAACLFLENHNEVVLGQFAQQRATNQQVKQFAETMVKDHTEFMQRLQPIAQMTIESIARDQSPARNGDNDVTNRTNTNQTNVQGPADQRQDRPQAQPQAGQGGQPQPGQAGQRGQGADQAFANARGQGGEIDPLTLKKELAAQCLNSARTELEQKQGTEFDMCYIGMQIGAHMHALDTMTVFRNHASPELARTLDEGIKTVRHHLDEAKKIAKDLHRESLGKAADSKNL
ncbi:MAG: DUF4142 domain-containing protein [Planctomycetaceae bacterium]|nr:DUF4142 domain-containing protein [Planctomycetaceae bacterium]